MSSTFVADNVDDKDESLIIIVNPDGTITVDPETLQKLIANQHQGNVSVVRMDGEGNSQTQTDSQDDMHVNLTVEGFYPPPLTNNNNSNGAVNSQHLQQQIAAQQQQQTATQQTVTTAAQQQLIENDILSGTDVGGEVVVDPFSQMDPEQLARLETVLQSEKAKEILGHDLGENILDVGTVLETSPVGSVVHNDHSYTTTVQTPTKQQSAQVQQQSGSAQDSAQQSSQALPPPAQFAGVIQQLQQKQQQLQTNNTANLIVATTPVRTTTRGRGRGRAGRGVGGAATATGGVMTRGGIIRTGVVRTIQPQPQQQAIVVSNQGILTTKSIGPGKKVVIQQGAGARLAPATQAQRIAVNSGSGGIPGAKVVHRRVLVQKSLPNLNSTSPATPGVQSGKVQQQNLVTVQSEQQKNAAAALLLPNNDVPVVKKAGGQRRGVGHHPGARAGHRGRGGGRGGHKPTEPREDLRLLDDEMAATLEAMHTDSGASTGSSTLPPPPPPRPPDAGGGGDGGGVTSTSGDTGVNTPLLTPASLEVIKKREPSVLIKKLSPRTLENATGGNRHTVVLKTMKTKDSVKTLQSATKASRKSADSTTSPQGSGKSISDHTSDETKKKKDKPKAAGGPGGHHHHHQQQPPTPLVLGPELFSTPDIIRRVDKQGVPVVTSPGAVEEHQRRSSGGDQQSRPPQGEAAPTTPTPRTPTPGLTTPPSAPTTPTGVVKSKPCKEGMTPESLLDTIHAEVAANELTADNQAGGGIKATLTDALMLDNLTTDDASISGGNVESQIMSSHIEETLERMEASGLPANKLTVVASPSPINSPSEANPPVRRALPAVGAENSAAKQEPAHGKNQLRKHVTIKEKRTSTDSRKQSASDSQVSSETEALFSSSGRKRKVTEKVAALQREQQLIMRKKRRMGGGAEGDEAEDVLQDEDMQEVAKRQVPLATGGDADSESAESDEESWNSEDDPDRLWCICQKPHNNRFMICCDTCEDWFHGKCVGITKALGQQMEQRGIEWSCPNCKKEKEAKANQNAVPSSTVTSPLGHQQQPPQAGGAPTEVGQPARKAPEQTRIGSLECHVCKKPARANSIYCSDVCIRKHVFNSLLTIKKETDRLQSSSRVVICERKTGRIISGDKAPTVEGLVDWLLAHQTYEVVRPSALPKQYNNQQQQQQQQQQSQPQQQQQQAAGAKVAVQQQTPTAPGVKQLKPPAGVGPKGTAGSGGPPLKQTILTTRPMSGAKIIFATKPPVTQKVGGIQLIQPQPQIVLTPKGQRAMATDQALTVDQNGKVRRVVVKPASDGTPSASSQKPPQTGAKKLTAGPKPEKKEKKQRKDSVESKAMTPTTPVAISSPPTTTVMTSPTATTAPAVTTTLNTTGQPSVGSQPEAKKEEPEPVRANVRRTLHELLDQRAKQDTEINMTSTEIDTLSVEIEEELYNYFKDTGAKYKSKYRSLVFNIKDPKNLTLYKKILGKSISPGQLVRLTPEELASQELAQWREKEAKHQLEIIKKNELDLIHQAKTVVLKSRKGEEVIETKNHKANISELESALNRTAEDYEVQEKNSTCVKGEMKVDSELLKLEEKLKTREKEERRKNDSRKKSDRKADRKHDRGRSRSRKNSGRSRRSHSHRSHSKRSPSEKHSSRHHKKVVKEEEEEREEPNIKTEVKTEDVVDNPAEVKVEDCAVEEDSSSNSSDREPSSTVTINTPPYIDAEEEEQQPTPVWKGTLNMTEVTKLFTKAFEVSGSCEDLGEELSEHLECVGRIQPESVWDYVSRMKKAGTKNIIVVRFASESHQEKMNYLALYSYLNSRNRMAVIGNVSKTIKDFYVLPLASHSPIPQVLLPLDGPGFEDYRPHLLLGIIIRSRKVSPYSFRPKSKSVSATSYRSRTPERSYTPPLPTDGGGSTTPPIAQAPGTPPKAGQDDDDNEPYSPGEDDPYSPGGGDNDADMAQQPMSGMESSTSLLKDNHLDGVTPDIQKNLEEVNRMIEQKRQQIESITLGTAVGVAGGPTSLQSEEEEAYSPSESFTPPRPPVSETIPFFDSKTLPNISLPSNLHEILASIKNTTAAASSSQQDVKTSDPIVKAYKMYKGEEDDDDEEEDSSGKGSMSPLSVPLPPNLQPPLMEPSLPVANRDPRQRPPPPQPLLSQLSDAELIRRAAAEMQPPSIPIPPTVVEEPPPPVYYPPPMGMPPPPPPQPLGYPPPPMPPPHPPYAAYPPPLPPETKYKFRDDDKRPRPHHRGGGYHRGGGRPYRPYNRSYRYNHGGGGGGQYYGGRQPPPPPQSQNLQSEWEEEIRNFEHRKSKEAAERERRKRRMPSRSPSPQHRHKPSSPGHSRRRSHT